MTTLTSQKLFFVVVVVVAVDVDDDVDVVDAVVAVVSVKFNKEMDGAEQHYVVLDSDEFLVKLFLNKKTKDYSYLVL